jgi:hypothetical protein
MDLVTQAFKKQTAVDGRLAHDETGASGDPMVIVYSEDLTEPRAAQSDPFHDRCAGCVHNQNSAPTNGIAHTQPRPSRA